MNRLVPHDGIENIKAPRYAPVANLLQFSIFNKYFKTFNLIHGRNQLPQVLKEIEALASISGSKSLVCILSNINQNETIYVTKESS